MKTGTRTARIALTSLSAIAAAGCADVALSDRGPYPHAARRAQEQVQVRVGDVIHLTTWMNGFPMGRNWEPPTFHSYRLPVRKVAARDGRLTAAEAAMLGSFLSTHKHSASAPAADLFEGHELALWNGLATSLLVTRGGVASDELHVSLDSFCPLVTEEMRRTFLQECAAGSPATDEVRNVEALAGALDPVTRNRGNLQPGSYYQNQNNTAVAVATAELERGGASMRNAAGDELRWSLAEWQESGVCADPVDSREWEIASIIVRRGWRRLRVADSPASFEVQVKSDAARGVDLIRVRAGSTISRASLAYLYPSDVAGIAWRVRGGFSSARLPRSMQVRCSPEPGREP